jgi:hypothetical protein
MLDSEIRREGSTFADSQNLTGPGSEGVQWTLKNVERKTVELSRQAARKRGMKFGKWVTEVLRAAAIAEIEGGSRDEKELLAVKMAAFESKLDERIEKIQKQGQEIQHDIRVLQLLVPTAGKTVGVGE